MKKHLLLVCSVVAAISLSSCCCGGSCEKKTNGTDSVSVADTTANDIAKAKADTAPCCANSQDTAKAKECAADSSKKD